jgi:hypothetical protein
VLPVLSKADACAGGGPETGGHLGGGSTGGRSFFGIGRTSDRCIMPPLEPGSTEGVPWSGCVGRYPPLVNKRG